MLDPDVGAEALVEPTGHVPGHHHVVGGVQGGVGHDAVGELEPRALQPRRGGHDADADHHDIGVEHGAVVELDPVDRGAAGLRRGERARTPTPVRSSTPWSACRAPHAAPISVAEHAGQRLRAAPRPR